MPSRPGFAFLNGSFVPYSDAHVPIDDRGLQFGESLYEVLPITAGRPRLLESHVERMQRAAPEVGLASGVPALEEWARIVDGLLQREPQEEALLYAQVTGGATARLFVPDVAPAPTFFAYVTPYRFPRDEDVVRGTSAVTLPDLRWARRDLKTTMLLPAVLAKREARSRGAQEALLVGADGCVNEGASSNVFVVDGGVLVTPAQSPSLLPGTMRPLVLDAARESGIAVKSEPIPVDRLRAATEVLVSSSSQLVMPVIALDARPVGSGSAGPVGRRLASILRARLSIPG